MSKALLNPVDTTTEVSAETPSPMSQQTFEDLWRQHRSFVYSLALRLSERQSDAEDITQEVFIRVYRFFHQFRGKSVRTWLYRIVTNVFFTRYRSQKKENHVPLEWEDNEGNHLDTILTDDRNIPSNIIDDQVISHELRTALDRLPKDFRTVLVLQSMYDLSYEEIANRMRIPLGTVRSRLSRARDMFKRHLSHIGYVEGLAA